MLDVVKDPSGNMAWKYLQSDDTTADKSSEIVMFKTSDKTAAAAYQSACESDVAGATLSFSPVLIYIGGQ